MSNALDKVLLIQTNTSHFSAIIALNTHHEEVLCSAFTVLRAALQLKLHHKPLQCKKVSMKLYSTN